MNILYKYDVALSFAGEDREYVEEVALQLRGYGVKVFYDKFEEKKLWGKNLYDYLMEVYTKNAKFAIMFISKHYKEKLWTNHERESMQARAFKSSEEYILPVRFDDTEIPGMLSTIGYIDLKDKEPSYLVGLVLTKIGWQLKKRWWGRWEVESSTSMFSSRLEIYEVTKRNFIFTLSTSNGAHGGEISGNASFIDENEASFVDENKVSYASEDHDNGVCKLIFKKINDVIQVNDDYNSCWYYHGMRAYFSGDYRLKKDSFYDLNIVSDVILSSIYRILGDEHWSYYNDCFLDIGIQKPNSLDDSNTEVITGGVPGLYTVHESILMINKENIWGAFIKDDTVYFFTNTNQKKLPDTIIKWKERFSEEQIVWLT